MTTMYIHRSRLQSGEIKKGKQATFVINEQGKLRNVTGRVLDFYPDGWVNIELEDK